MVAAFPLLLSATVCSYAADEPVVVGPISEVRRHQYEDATYRPIAWEEVKELSRKTDARRLINRRRLGQNTLRLVFTGAAVTELYFATRLIRGNNTWGYPLAAHGAVTAIGAGTLWSTIPRNRREERAERLDQVNEYLRIKNQSALP